MKLRNNRFLRSSLSLAAIVAVGICQNVSAASDTWAAAVSGDWNTAANWTGNQIPGAANNTATTDTAGFGGAADYSVYLAGNRSIEAVTISNTGAFNLSGGTTATPSNQTWYLHAGLTVNAGSGAVTIGDTAVPPTRSVDIKMGTSTIANNSSNLLTLANGLGSRGTSSTTTITLGGTGNTLVGGQLGISDGATVALTKADAGTVTLSGANTYTGGTTVNAGTVRATDNTALGTGNIQFAANTSGRIELSGGIRVTTPFATINGRSNDNANVSNFSGINELTRAIAFTTGGLRFNAESQSGFLRLTGGITTNQGGRGITLRGAGFAEQTGIIGGTGTTSLKKLDAGTWILSGTSPNTYTLGTTISAGTLIAAKADALGTGATNNVTVAANSGLTYAASADAELAIGGTLAITGGTNTVIGGSIGSTPTNAQINVAGNASATGNIKVNVHGIDGVTIPSGTDTFTLVHGAGVTNTLDVATYSLGTVFNNTDFTVGSPSATATDLTIPVTHTSALTTAFWKGGLAGLTKTWAASDGSAASNWAATNGGADQPLVPGSGADITIGTSYTNDATASALGANMHVNSLTIADTTSGLTLNNDGFTLKLGAGGITMDSGVPASTIDANLELSSAQTWANNSANPLAFGGLIANAGNTLTIDGSGNTTISGILGSGAGSGGLVKQGAGTLFVTAINPYTGGTTINQGTVKITRPGCLGTGALSIDTAGIADINYGTLSGTVGHALVTTGTGSLNATPPNAGVFQFNSGSLTGFAGTIQVKPSPLNNARVDFNGLIGTGSIVNIASGATARFLSSGTYTGIAINVAGTGGSGPGALRLESGTLDNTCTITLTANASIGAFSPSSGTIQAVIADGSGTFSLTKVGSSTLSLTATNTYGGDTIVSGGTLSLGNGTNNTSLDDAANVNISAGTTLNLNYSGTDTIKELWVNGVQKASGVYEAVGNPGGGIEIPEITGSGTLTVTTGPATAGYSAWQTANGTSQTVDLDHDNDGVDNGIEYFLGGNTVTTGFTALPAPVAGAVTWTKAATYTGTLGIDFRIQSSTDLATWTAAATSGSPGVPGTVFVSGSSYVYTLPTGAGKTFVRLLVNPN